MHALQLSSKSKSHSAFKQITLDKFIAACIHAVLELPTKQGAGKDTKRTHVKRGTIPVESVYDNTVLASSF